MAHKGQEAVTRSKGADSAGYFRFAGAQTKVKIHKKKSNQHPLGVGISLAKHKATKAGQREGDAKETRRRGLADSQGTFSHQQVKIENKKVMSASRHP